MPLIYHEIGHNPAGKQAGASVELFLKEGLISKALLRESGKLPLIENPYERALKRRKNWQEERQIALKNNPQLLKAILDNDKESTWVRGDEIFYKPGHPAHREENIFFMYSEHPSCTNDWVAIEVPDTVTLHDASCRDQGDPDKWLRTAVTINQFQAIRRKGETPIRWESLYNEHLIRNKVSPEKIVAYAKLEKELPILGIEISKNQLQQVQSFINDNLNFATQFEDPRDNVLLQKLDDKYLIRISFNKAKIAGRESEVDVFFNQFDSFKKLIEVTNKRENYFIKNSSLFFQSQPNEEREKIKSATLSLCSN